MTAPRLVVVEHDDWVLRLLAEGLREGGFVVTTATSYDDALAKVREIKPDAVLSDVALGMKDGYLLTIKLRAEPAPLSIVPIALLADEDDEVARTTAFDAGADALLTRPFRIDEVVAQMNALVALARRMRERRTSLVDSLAAGPPSTTFRGDLAHMPAPSLLLLLEVERKSGTVEVRHESTTAILEMADGCVTSAKLGAVTDPIAVLRTVIGWKEGRVEFVASAARPRPPGAKALRALLASAGWAATTEITGAAPPAISRNPAMRPPPGQRISQAAMRAVVAPQQAPALEAVDTRKVDVPTISATLPKPHEEPKPPRK